MFLLQEKEEGPQGLVKWGFFPGHGFVPILSKRTGNAKQEVFQGLDGWIGGESGKYASFLAARHCRNPDDRGIPGPVFGGAGRFLLSFKICQTENVISLAL